MIPLLIRPRRFFQLFLIYAVICAGATGVAFLLRFDFILPYWWSDRFWVYLLAATSIKLIALYLFGQFHGLISHFRFPDLERLFYAVSVSSGIILGLHMLFESMRIGRGTILIDYILTLAALAIFRVGLRRYRERYSRGTKQSRPRQSRIVVIVGAGEVGGSLCSEYLSKPYLGIRPVAFFDDDVSKHGQSLHGVPVVGVPARIREFCKNTAVDSIIITMPRAGRRRVAEIVEIAREMNLKTEIIPSLHQIVSGHAKISQIRPVQFEDLLGRDPVQLNTAAIEGTISGKCVLVTGAGGSIGSELARQLLMRRPAKLLLVDVSEAALFAIQQELLSLDTRVEMVFKVTHAGDGVAMEKIFMEYAPQLVFHAAAYKHVPLMEFQPTEAVLNNSVATYRLARLASDHRVERFTLVSTDKAIHPTSVMGASKRLAEIALQGLSRLSRNKTRFIAVRFGNVLGSSGSVIPTFRRQITEGGPVTVTHAETSRYFMTVSEAVGLILQSAVMGRGGEIFVLQMGKPVKIVDVARNLIELSGYEPDRDIQIKFIGLRPGEKLHEKLELRGEQFEPTAHPRVVRYFSEELPTFEAIQEAFEILEAEAKTRKVEEMKLLIARFVPEYTPWNDNQASAGGTDAAEALPQGFRVIDGNASIGVGQDEASRRAADRG